MIFRIFLPFIDYNFLLFILMENTDIFNISNKKFYIMLLNRSISSYCIGQKNHVIVIIVYQ